MTLCVAWLRRVDERHNELIFATDSCLTGSETWHSGIKLFDLSRKDCLLCFRGATSRAYPLILNSILSIRFDDKLSDPRTDIHDILDHLTDLFSQLCEQIMEPVEDIHIVRGEAEFIFGGWSWREQSFCIWRVYYSTELESFTHESLSMNEARVFTFIGDHTDKASELLVDELTKSGKILAGTLDMEPVKVLARMSRDTSAELRAIGGALQIAKVYSSGTIEFFGVMWPSIDGRPSFLGKELLTLGELPIRYIDPDSGTIIEERLPSSIDEINESIFEDGLDFVRECYPENRLKDQLGENDRAKLRSILKDVAYRAFVERCEANSESDR